MNIISAMRCSGCSSYPLANASGFVMFAGGSAATVIGVLAIIYNLGYLTGRLSGLNSLSIKSAAYVLSSGSFLSIVSIALICYNQPKKRTETVTDPVPKRDHSPTKITSSTVTAKVASPTAVKTKSKVIDWKISETEEFDCVWVQTFQQEQYFDLFREKYKDRFKIKHYNNKSLKSFLKADDSQAGSNKRSIILVLNTTGEVYRYDARTWWPRRSSVAGSSGT